MATEKYFSNKKTYVSFILSVIVLYIHANNIHYFGEQSIKYTSFLETIVSGYIGDTVVPTFFIISGFLFYRNIDLNIAIMPQILKKWKSRIYTLLVPYFLWNLIGTMFYMFVPRIPLLGGFISGGAVEVSLKNLALGVFHYEYYFPLWYLFYLLILVLFTPIFCKILRSRIITSAFIFAFVVGHILRVNMPVISCSSIVFFLTGAGLSLYLPNVWLTRWKKKYAFGSVTVLGLIVLTRFLFTGSMVERFLYLVAPYFLWHSFDLLAFSKEGKGYIKQSFFIYCAHIIPLTIIEKICIRLLAVSAISSELMASITYFVSPIITLTFLFFVYTCCSRVSPKLYSLISGGRK